MTKNRWADSSGLEFAGFGDQQIFPCVKSFRVECVVCDKTRLYPTDAWSQDMNEIGSAPIIPFAQAEIVHRFLRRIDPEYKRKRPVNTAKRDAADFRCGPLCWQR
jgi:hypothetical protein